MRWFAIVCLFVTTACSRQRDGSFASRWGKNIENIAYHDNAAQIHWRNARVPIVKLLDSLHINLRDIRIVIRKSAYELGVYKDTVLLKNYPVVFGGNPVDDKLMQGDNCTPEGVFRIRTKYPHAKWSRFIWIDYPNADSWKKHNAAIARGAIPKNSDIGGEVGIHGIPEGYDEAIDLRQNWTLGCISMKNKDVIDLYPVVHKDILIEIRK